MNEQVPSKELCDCCESRRDRRCCWDEITSLRGQLEAAEQHVKVLRENLAAHKPGCAISSYLRGADRVTCDCGGTAPEPGLSLEERMHRFPKRGWAIDVGVPFSASDPEAEHPLTFRAKHLGGDWDEFESLDLDGAVTWLEQRLGITKGGKHG